MCAEIEGKLTYANGLVAPGVEVRVFDKDAPGKGDDDLTVSPGVTDEKGKFKVTFDPGRYMDSVTIPFIGLRRAEGSSGIKLPDPLDLLLPYLKFRYTLDDQACEHDAAIVPFQTHYKLPNSPKIQFQPSVNGFRFPNAFRGYMLPFTLPFLPDASKVSSIYGLCGGMSSAACDFLLANRSIPQVTDVPTTGTKFQRYLFRRAIDTFAMGESILKFARWMALPEEGPNGTYHLTEAAFDTVRETIDGQRPCVIGLVYAKGATIQEIATKVWNNHQVLAYTYRANWDGSYDLYLYDPNYPNSDNISIHAEKVDCGTGPDGSPLTGWRCTQMRGEQPLQPVRGFFPMPYEPADPPKGL